MKTMWVALLGTAFAAACGSPAEDPPPVVAEGGGGTGGGGGGGGGGALPEPGCAVDIVWEEGPALPAGRDHHHTFGFDLAGGSHLFIAGGTDYDAILADNWQLGVEGWTQAPALPRSTAGAALAVVGRHVFLAGGQTPGDFLTDVITAAVGDDGALGGFTAAASLPEARFHGAMAHVGGQLVFTGGLEKASFAATDSLFHAPVDESGAIGPWVAETLPSPRSHHVSFAVDGWIYVAGGLEGSPMAQPTILADVWRAPVDDDGSIGTWEALEPLPEAIATMAPLVRGRCAYLFGGLAGLTYRDVVLASPIDDEGRTGTWVALPSRLPEGRSHMHHVALLGDRVHLGGGSVAYQTVTTRVAVGTFVDAD